MANPLKVSLLARERQLVGCWTMFASPLVAEAMAWTGYDMIVIDAEHTPLSAMNALHCLQAVAGTPCLPLLRLPDDNPTMIKQMMDAGAASLMVPMIDSAEQARNLVRATRYAPQGIRGFAAMHRASRFGADADYISTANESVLLIAQIETPAAVEALDDILAVEGIDGVFIGPGDLSAAMGRIGQAGSDEMLLLMEDCAKRAHAAGKPVGGLALNTAMARRLLDAGYDFVPVSNDIALMTRAARATLQDVCGDK